MKTTKKIDWKDILIVVLDVIAVNFSYLFALMVRFFENGQVSHNLAEYWPYFIEFAPFYTVNAIAVFALFRLYNGMWRYAGINDLNRIIIANFITTIIHVAGTLLFVKRMPISYYILGAVIQFILIVCIRFIYKFILMEKAKIIRHTSPAGNVMIVGAGENVIRTIRYIDEVLSKEYRVVCILDDKNGRSGIRVDGVPVIGGADRLIYSIEKYKVRNIFIANPLLDNDLRKTLKSVCKERYINLKDYSGFLAYLENSDDASLLDIQQAPVTVKVKGGEKRIIPFSPPDIGEKEIGEVTEALRSGWITTGPRTKLLERRLAAYIETGDTNYDTEEDKNRWSNRVVCLNSATSSEEMNFRIFGIGPGDEVIVPAYTYTASASAAIHCGATVRFIDIQKDGDKNTHMPEPDYGALEAAIGSKTKAVVIVDLGGIVADYDRVFEIVERKRSLFTPKESDGTPLGDLNSRIQKAIGRVAVFSDCAHSLGASRTVGGEKKYCGAIADFTDFSFHAVKNFTTAEGGAATWRPLEGIDNAEIYHMYQLLSLHGQSKDALAKTKVGAWEYDIIGPWYKCNMTDIMAAIGLRQLDRYKGLLDRRVEIIKKYDAVCDELGISHLVHHTGDMDSSNHLYLIRIPGIDSEKRNRIIEKMAEAGVATNVHFKPLPMMTAYKNLGWDIKDFPNTYDYYRNLVTLPLHTLLSDEDVEHVSESLKSVVKEVL